jgi:hypothetical protein
MQDLLREMGNYQANYELDAKELADTHWKQTAQQVLKTLLKGSPADFTQSFDELVIVPDGVLWYMPFEALQIKADGRQQALIERFRIRYAPTLSLATSGGWGRSAADNTAVILGKLNSGEDIATVKKAFDQLVAVVPGAAAIQPPPPAPTSLYSTIFRRLVVLDDIPFSEQSPYGWSPAPIDRSKTGSSLADWLLLPWGGPDVVVLPGFHTAAEDALKRVRSSMPGNEVFLAITGLMANGSRTILMSRWRTGGQTSLDLTREFAQELSDTSPSDAWQRAVQVVESSRLNWEAEPRLKRLTTDATLNAEHPFFWAGYMLVDSGTGPKSLEQKPEPAEKDAKKAAPAPEGIPPKAAEKHGEGSPKSKSVAPPKKDVSAGKALEEVPKTKNGGRR